MCFDRTALGRKSTAKQSIIRLGGMAYTYKSWQIVYDMNTNNNIKNSYKIKTVR